jgi:hypothetical protein
MVVANPLTELDDLSGDESEQSDGTPEEELRSNPSARSEGNRTNKSITNFTRANPSTEGGTRSQSEAITNSSSSRTHLMAAGEGTRTNESIGNFTKNPNLHHSILALEATKETTDKEARAHTHTTFVDKGWGTLTRELSRESRRPNKKPLAFARMANGEPLVQIIHGFAEMTTETDTHPCHGLMGGFIGDRLVIEVEGSQVVHEPPFATLHARKTHLFPA